MIKMVDDDGREMTIAGMKLQLVAASVRRCCARAVATGCLGQDGALSQNAAEVRTGWAMPSLHPQCQKKSPAQYTETHGQVAES